MSVLSPSEFAQIYASDRPMDASRTLALYQRFYERQTAASGISLPAGAPQDMVFVESLAQSLAGIEGLILDSYGVIGLGDGPIAGIGALFAAAKSRNIPVVILTNGASQPASYRVAGYQSWDLPVVESDIISSRDAAYQRLSQIAASKSDVRISYLGTNLSGFDDLPGPIYGQESDSDYGYQWDEAEYFAFLGAIGWGEGDQARFEAALTRTGAKVIVGNPDVSAPVAQSFTYEPGFWAMRAQEATNCELIMTGKPFAPAFDIAFAALEKKAGKALDKAQVGMVGDSLHTDILGAKNFGLKAILLSSYGLLKGRDVAQEADRAKIYPDMVARYL